MSSDRLEEILEVLMAYARQDFSLRLRVSPRLDEIDAVATGINLLAEELDGEVASRRELEAAYQSLHDAHAQLVIAEKFAALGQLASGVAHELNNPATWVLLGLRAIESQVVRARASLDDRAALEATLTAIDHAVNDTKAGVERMHAVVGELRAFARTDAEPPSPQDINAVVRGSCNLARPTYAAVAELELELAEVPHVLGDRNRLGQLVTNLLVNAAHAVAERPGPHAIVVSTRLEDDTVIVAVEDTGPGIPDDMRERVFDPYFTTKPTALGMGLGLALVRNIATQHGGSAHALRGARGGALIEIRLPATAHSPVEVTTRAASRRAATRARVLLVDDEPLLLKALSNALDDEHDVVTALGGEAALEVLASDRQFDLILCDLQMPTIDGVAIHEELAARSPELVDRFVVMSGGAMTRRAAAFLKDPATRAVGKPIEIDQLLELVRSST